MAGKVNERVEKRGEERLKKMSRGKPTCSGNRVGVGMEKITKNTPT